MAAPAAGDGLEALIVRAEEIQKQDVPTLQFQKLD
jgi:hypothetical protein